MRYALLIVAIMVGGEKQDTETCKVKYGNQYTLEHSSANSSIKWCQSPDGVMKAL